ncbi:hypothetical protein AB0B25_04830 [Nocardia sp. NPDC049190]|uniref:hypothetical protein n=1 Tax=Nocardia sp. NPDC049190 TaxID=3155650 RepID=UPI0033E6E08C
MGSGKEDDKRIAEIIKGARALDWAEDEYQLFLLTRNNAGSDSALPLSAIALRMVACVEPAGFHPVRRFSTTDALLLGIVVDPRLRMHSATADQPHYTSVSLGLRATVELETHRALPIFDAETIIKPTENQRSLDQHYTRWATSSQTLIRFGTRPRHHRP